MITSHDATLYATTTKSGDPAVLVALNKHSLDGEARPYVAFTPEQLRRFAFECMAAAGAAEELAKAAPIVCTTPRANGPCGCALYRDERGLNCVACGLVGF